MSAAKLTAYNTADAMKSEEKVAKPEREGQDILDNVIRQAIGKEPFLSFSRAGDSPVRLIQLLHALDQQGSEKTSRSSKMENYIEGKHPLDSYNGATSFSSEMNGTKESAHSLRGSGNSIKGTKSTSEQLQSLKIPEAVVAFAQAAAKANGEPEKYLPGWPLSSPSKVQLEKCSKCSQEFCSAINHRRHIRVHRRSLNIVKDSSKTRNLLAEFWDKLSPDRAKELLSFQNVAVEGVTGSSVMRALSSWVRKPGLSSLPPKYVKAGGTILDIVNTRPSRFPTSQELFSVLDEASEKTFLSAGTAVSLQKYVFDSEAGKNALEMKNLVACTSFLLEQILLKAWVVEKDAEALRCQKLLVEEEEAAQKRHAKLLERKRLKKLRQKEQKAKELSDVVKVDSKVSLSDTAEGTSSSGSLSPRVLCDLEMNISDASLDQGLLPLEHAGPVDPDLGENLWLPFHEDVEQNAAHKIRVTDGHCTSVSTRRVLIKQSRNASNGFFSGQVPAKSSGFTQHGNYRDPKAGMLAISHKVWTQKSKPENQAEATSDRVTIDREQPVLSDGSEVLIGSISVALGEANGQHQLSIVRDDNLQEKLVKSNSSGAAMKLWRPVDRRKGSSTTAKSDMSSEENAVPAEVAKPVLSDLDHLTSCGMDDISIGKSRDLKVYSGTELSERRLFSSEAAEAFLAQRWKEAIASDHVKLILFSDSETSTCDGSLKASHTQAQPQALDFPERSILGNAENRMAGVGLIRPTTGVSKPKFRQKYEQSFRLKYIPKQRSNI